jgi:MFS transporter, DHA1 family, inner membrane transport protein
MARPHSPLRDDNNARALSEMRPNSDGGANRSLPRDVVLTCGLLALGQFALVTSVFMLTGLLPAISDHYRVSTAAAGQVIGIFSLSYAVSAPFLAIATARLPRRPLLVGVLLVFCMTNLLAAIAPGFGWLLATRVLAAATDGLYAATATAVAAAIAPAARRGLVLAIVNTGVTLAFVVGVPLGTYVGQTFGWRGTFYMVAAIAAIAAMGLALAMPAAVTPPVASFRSRLAVLRTPGVLPTLGVAMLSYSGLFIIYTFLAPLLASVAGVPASDMRRMLLAFGLATVAGNALGGLAADRWGSSATIAASLIIVAPLLAALPLVATTPASAVALLFAWGVVHYAGLSPLQHRMATLAPKNADVALALNGSAIYLGVAAGSAVGGLALGLVPIAALGILAAIFKLGAFGMLALSNRAFQGGSMDSAAVRQRVSQV